MVLVIDCPRRRGTRCPFRFAFDRLDASCVRCIGVVSSEPEVPSDPLGRRRARRRRHRNGRPGPPTPPPSVDARARRAGQHSSSSVAIAGLFIPMSYVIIEPGDATPVSGVVSVKGAPTYPSRGSLLFLTVSMSNGKPNLWRYLAASLDDDAEVISYDDYFGDHHSRTGPQAQRAGDGHVAGGGDQGRAREARLHRDRDPGPARACSRSAKDAPARGKLEPGDVITAVDGQPVTLVDQLGPARACSARRATRSCSRSQRKGDEDDVATVTVKTAAQTRGTQQGFGVPRDRRRDRRPARSTSRSTSRSTPGR